MNDWFEKLKMRLPAIFLLAATLLFWPNFDPCKPDGPVLLESPSLADAAYAKGDCSETNSVFTLRMREAGTNPEVGFVLPSAAGHGMIRLSGRIHAEGVVRGRYPYSSAWLMLVQRDDAGRWLYTSNSQMYGDGTFGWTAYLNDYPIHRKTARVEVVIQQLGRSGMAQFDSLKAYPVRAKRSIPWIKAGFGIAWFVLGVLYYFRCRLHTRKLRHLILLNALVIIVGVLLPNHWLQLAPGMIREALSCSKVYEASSLVCVQAGFGVTEHFEATVGRSLGHFVLFASLSFLVLLSAALEGEHPSRYYAKVACDVLLFGLITEALQYLTPDRTVDVLDMLCNAYGMLAAMTLFAVVWKGSAVGKLRLASLRAARPPENGPEDQWH